MPSTQYYQFDLSVYHNLIDLLHLPHLFGHVAFPNSDLLPTRSTFFLYYELLDSPLTHPTIFATPSPMASRFNGCQRGMSAF